MKRAKRIAVLAALALGFGLSAAPAADAGVFVRRVAPVRRVAARAVLPPYPVARRAVYGPVYRPYVRPYVRPYGAYYRAPVVYGPGVSISVGF